MVIDQIVVMFITVLGGLLLVMLGLFALVFVLTLPNRLWGRRAVVLRANKRIKRLV
jgi:putative copper export protein